jgi:hypothetical protein
VIGVLAGLNYAVSFVLIQSCHFVLATKQPSMTAATCAGIIRSTRGESLERTGQTRRPDLPIANCGGLWQHPCRCSRRGMFDVIWKASTGRPI